MELLLIQAMETQYGIVVRSNKPEQLRQKLYAIRRKNPIYHPLSFVLDPDDPENILWIIYKPEESADVSSEE